MKDMKHYLTAALLAAALPLMAQPTDRATALEKAQALMNDKGVTFHKEQVLHRAAAHDVAPYYIFNGDRGRGFVVVGGVEGAPVLGYSVTGRLDAAQMAPALRSLLDAYGRRAAGVQASDVTVVSRAATATRLGDDIAWTESARWFQESPFSDQCPTVTVYTDAQHQNVLNIGGLQQQNMPSVTGCVATALAIVFYQNKYPTKTIAAIADRTGQVTEGSYMDPATNEPLTTYAVFADQGFPAGTAIEYDKMKQDYLKYDAQGGVVMDGTEPVIDATDAQKAAVAKLMHLCGGLMDMKYSIPQTGGSAGANNDMMRGLWKYVGVTSATIHRQEEYTLKEWQQMLYDELKAGHAVHYGGSSFEGGHAFVCDGYQFKDNSHLFHINWGWGPHSSNDGYYNIELLAPINYAAPQEGPTMAGFTMGQNIVRGLYQGATAQPYEPFCSKFTLNGDETITLRDGKISLPLVLKVNNTSYQKFDAYLAAIVIDQQGQQHAVPLGTLPVEFDFTDGLDYEADDNYHVSFDYNAAYGKELKMYLAYRTSATGEWKECRGNSRCAFTVKDDGSVEPFIVKPYELKLVNSGVTNNTIAAGEELAFTTRIKIDNGSVHEPMDGVLEPIEASGQQQPEEVKSKHTFMVYGDQGDVLDVKLTFDGSKVPAGRYRVLLAGQTTGQSEEIFLLTVTSATGVEAIDHSPSTIYHSAAYDLQGHEVTDSYRGIVVKKGKKTVRK